MDDELTDLLQGPALDFENLLEEALPKIDPELLSDEGDSNQKETFKLEQDPEHEARRTAQQQLMNSIGLNEIQEEEESLVDESSQLEGANNSSGKKNVNLSPNQPKKTGGEAS